MAYHQLAGEAPPGPASPAAPPRTTASSAHPAALARHYRVRCSPVTAQHAMDLRTPVSCTAHLGDHLMREEQCGSVVDGKRAAGLLNQGFACGKIKAGRGSLKNAKLRGMKPTKQDLAAPENFSYPRAAAPPLPPCCKGLPLGPSALGCSPRAATTKPRPGWVAHCSLPGSSTWRTRR